MVNTLWVIMFQNKYLWLTVSVSVGMSLTAFCQKVILDSTRHHVRNGEVREWSEFPAHSHEKKLSFQFFSQPGNDEQTIRIRQYDVKQEWRVKLNGLLLGSLIQD